MTYLTHWGLDETPFRQGFDPRLFFRSPSHDEALARLHFLVEQRNRVCLLLGEGGTGKSFTLATFAGELQRRGADVALIHLASVEADELIWQIAAQWGLNPAVDAGAARLWRELADHVVGNRYQQVPTVLLWDDVDRARDDVASLILRLLHVDTSPSARLTFILAARERSLTQVDRRLLDLAELRIDLERWELEHTERFLVFALSQMGGTRPVFDSAAVSRLHQLASGVPRQVVHLAELALLAGAGQQVARVGAETIESVFYELGLVEVNAD